MFHERENARHERRIRFVVAFTVAMMVSEIVAGTATGSRICVGGAWGRADSRRYYRSSATTFARQITTTLLLPGIGGLARVTVEVQPCAGGPG